MHLGTDDELTKRLNKRAKREDLEERQGDRSTTQQEAQAHEQQNSNYREPEKNNEDETGMAEEQPDEDDTWEDDEVVVRFRPLVVSRCIGLSAFFIAKTSFPSLVQFWYHRSPISSKTMKIMWTSSWAEVVTMRKAHSFENSVMRFGHVSDTSLLLSRAHLHMCYRSQLNV